MPSRNILTPITTTRLPRSKLFGCVAFMLLWLCCLTTSLRADPILIGTTQSPSPQSLHIEEQLRTVYNQLGLQVLFIPMPSERRLRQVSNNQLGADLFRICQLGDDDDSLVTVQAKLGDLYLQAFSLSEQRLTNWQQQPELIVVHVRGLKMAELTPFAGSRLEVTDLTQAFGMLLQGRADIMLEDQLSAEAYLQQYQLPELTRVNLAPFAVCHVLSQELSHLAEPLQLLLQAMQN